MSAYGYRLVGNAKSMSPDYIPSLIGIDDQQVSPAPTDTYFEQVDLPAEAVNLNGVAITRWVCYDSLPGNQRDPIVAVKAAGHSYYTTLSELVIMVGELGRPEDRELVATLVRSRRP